MARDGNLTSKMAFFSISPSTASVTLFFFFLLVAMADEQELTIPDADSSPAAPKKIRSSSFPSSRQSLDNPKTNTIPFSPIGRKGGRIGGVDESRSFSWSGRVFNASAHEVPSGPNPISNSLFGIVFIWEIWKGPSVTLGVPLSK